MGPEILGTAFAEEGEADGEADGEEEAREVRRSGLGEAMGPEEGEEVEEWVVVTEARRSSPGEGEEGGGGVN